MAARDPGTLTHPHPTPGSSIVKPCDSVFFTQWKKISSVSQLPRPSRWEGDECGCETIKWGILVVMELFCNLTVLADTQTLIHPTHAYIQTHTNENKQNWKNLTRVGRTSYLVSVKILVVIALVDYGAMMNIWVQIFVWTCFQFSRMFSQVELLGDKITWNFCATIKLFSKVNAPFYMSINNVWGVQWLHALACSYPFFKIITIHVSISLWFILDLHFPNVYWYLAYIFSSGY